MRIATVLLLLAIGCPETFADKERDAAIRRAIQFLESRVPRLPDSAGTPRKPFVYATTGLVYLMDPVTRSGASRVRPLKDYLVRYVDEIEKRLAEPASLPARHGAFSSQNLIQYTWPVAQATLFFGELHARGRYRAEMGKVIRRAVRILEAAQQQSGGWGHGLVRDGKEIDPFGEKRRGMIVGNHGYPATLVSASNTVAIALGSVRELVPSKSADRAREYYRRAQLSNGAFPYDPSQRTAGRAKTNPSRTAGSVYAMHCLGMPRDRAMERSIDYVLGEFEYLPEGHGSSTLNLFQAALFCHALGPSEWKRFRDAFEKRILAKQDADGHLACICADKAFGATNDSKDPFGGRAGGLFMEGRRTYTTSLHAFILLLDRGKLKLHQPMKKKRVTTAKR